MKRHAVLLVATFLLLPLVACEQQSDLPTGSFPGEQMTTTDALSFARVADEPAVERIAAFVREANAKLEAGGSDLRLDYPWLFRVGPGSDPYARLRTGSRWTKASLAYVLDESDYTTDLAVADLEAALESSFQSWNDVGRTYVEATRQPDDVGPNPDFLDGTFAIDEEGNEVCRTVLDFTSPTLLGVTPGGGLLIEPTTDILVGGWPDAKYFELCLGSSDVIGVTWTLSTSDQNGDGYRDIAYVEQFYNPAFNWATEGSVYLDFSDDALTDLETIAAHENGHALGLGHFGGPVNRQPFKLQPNGSVFNPEAVMNPYYIGGEERTPLPTDVAGLTTLYTGHVTTTN